MKQYGRLDTKAKKDCKLIRDTSAVLWKNHSNYDVLTRWRSPGIPGSFFDHAISFRYKRMEGVSPRLKNYQCRLLVRGQDYEALRRLPVVQSIPFTDQQQIGPVFTDEKLRMIAVVFPQYHAFKENDLFWGTNFTEWTNLKLAYFNPWNFQPIKHPIEAYGGYYNMLSHSQRSRMGKLARFYGIQGFAFHHYWFECNTVFMESVIMEMLKDGQPDLPFMLIWANEAWTRHWTGETGEVLQSQSYGNETCWRLHFQWLLPLFKHPNYIKVNNKPAFGIYIVPLIKELKPMLKLWRSLAKEEGLPGLHIIQCLGHKDTGVSRNVNAIMEHNLDPHFVVGDLDDDPVHVEARLEERFRIARNDANNGTTPNLFFLTAWNEWGEGNVLEPNNIFGYGNLNAVALAYESSKHEASNDIGILNKLHESMDECRLKLDIQYYVDLAGAGLFHLLSGPEPEMRKQLITSRTMLSSLDAALESASGPRTAAFQPKLKPRARKGGAGGGAGAEAAAPAGQSGPSAGPSGGRTAPAGNVAGVAQAVAPPVRAIAAAVATVPSERTSASAQRPLPDAPISAPQLPSRSAAPEALGLGSPAPSSSAAVVAGATHQAEGLGLVQEGFGAPSRTATAAPPPAATAATGARASSASVPATAPTPPSSHAPTLPAPHASARPAPRAPAPGSLENGPHRNAAPAAHAAAAGAAPGTAVGAADAVVRGIGRGREKEKGASGGDKSRGVIGSGTKGVFFPHSFRKGKRRSQVTPELLAAEDLSGFTIQQIIQRSEVLDREKEKEEQEKKRIEEEVERNRRKLARRRGEDVDDDSEGPDASAPASNPPPGSSGDGGGVFAPQVTVIDGRIVVNEASLTVDAQGGRDAAMEGYKRVEESSARLNYGTHMKREKSDRWSVEETTLWYQALQQFGTDFEMLQALFPKRSRRQMKAKFKREEMLHPHLVTHALTHRCTDKQQYERLASALNPQLALQEGVGGEDAYGEGDYGAGADGTGEYGVVTQESVAVTQAEGDYGEAEYGEGEEEMGGTTGYEDPFAAYGGDGEVEEDPLGGYG
ncbi:unnamed protein product [Closterium sp. Yama58-4]|nr:unnamed protein product [Closterium sp. Yama58-4]